MHHRPVLLNTRGGVADTLGHSAGLFFPLLMHHCNRKLYSVRSMKDKSSTFQVISFSGLRKSRSLHHFASIIHITPSPVMSSVLLKVVVLQSFRKKTYLRKKNLKRKHLDERNFFFYPRYNLQVLFYHNGIGPWVKLNWESLVKTSHQSIFLSEKPSAK